MLTMRITMIQRQFNIFFSEICDNYKFNNNYEREEMITVFFINNLYYLLTKVNDLDTIIGSDDTESFDKTFNNKVEHYSNILFKKNLDDFNRILQICIAKGEAPETVRDSNRDTKDINKSIFDLNELNLNKVEVDRLSKTELKAAASQFNNKYREIFENVKKDVNESIKDKNNAKMIYKKFLNEIVIK